MIKHLLKLSLVTLLFFSFSAATTAQDSDGFIIEVIDLDFKAENVGLKIKNGRKTLNLTPTNISKNRDYLAQSSQIILGFTATDDLARVMKKGQKIRSLKIGDPGSKNAVILKNVSVLNTKTGRKMDQLTLGYTEVEWTYTDAGRVTY